MNKIKFKRVENSIRKNSEKIIMTSILVLSVFLILNIVLISYNKNILEDKIEKVKEANKPIILQLITISCNECSSTTSITDSIKSKNVDVTEEKIIDKNSEEAQSLISKYGISKLPSVLIFGEVESERLSSDDFDLMNDALVLNNIAAPYLDLNDNELKGVVIINEIIDSSCANCISLESIPLSLGESGVKISSWNKVEYNSAEGISLISSFGIKHVPALLISKDIDYYESIKQSLDQLGLDEKNGFYSLHSTLPPYRNLSANKIVGLVDLIMISDKTCTDCYDVTTNLQILNNLGIVVNTEKSYDVSDSSAKQLISKYNIEKVPMILLSPEADVYSLFVDAWDPVGTKENDGWFIMRKPDGLGKIKTL